MKVYDEIRNLANQYEHLAAPVLYTGKFDPFLLKVQQCTIILKEVSPEISSQLTGRTIITM